MLSLEAEEALSPDAEDAPLAAEEALSLEALVLSLEAEEALSAAEEASSARTWAGAAEASIAIASRTPTVRCALRHNFSMKKLLS